MHIAVIEIWGVGCVLDIHSLSNQAAYMTCLVTAILLFFIIGVVGAKLLRHGLQIQISH